PYRDRAGTKSVCFVCPVSLEGAVGEASLDVPARSCTYDTGQNPSRRRARDGRGGGRGVRSPGWVCRCSRATPPVQPTCRRCQSQPFLEGRASYSKGSERG
ncbi:unnamed protein product, partial [Scytosiphon promiscuus]